MCCKISFMEYVICQFSVQIISFGSMSTFIVGCHANLLSVILRHFLKLSLWAKNYKCYYTTVSCLETHMLLFSLTRIIYVLVLFCF